MENNCQLPLKEIADGGEGMVEEHAGAGIAHDFADAFAHFGLVAMDRAVVAVFLLLAKLAEFQPLMGIFQQLGAFGAQSFPGAMVVVAPDFYHPPDGLLLALYPCHCSG